MAKLKKILSGLNYLSVYLVILIILNISLLSFPLTKVFGYEFSAVNSIFIVFLTGFYSVSLLKQLKELKISLKDFSKRLLLIWLLFLILPALISFSNSVMTVNCSLKDGIEFYLVLAFPAVIIGLSLAEIVFVFSGKLARIFFIVLFLAILSIPLLEFYYNPQIYFYNPIFGYYPGTIYDEGLSVGIKLVIYRLFNSAFFGSVSLLLIVAVLKNSRALAFFLIIMSIITAALFYLVSPMLGYSTTFSMLEQKLGGKVVTPHFVIYYPLEMKSAQADAMVLYHEYYYSRLRDYFQFDFNGKIKSFVFLNDEQKKELFGSANADVAKPWLKSAFISRGDIGATLRHEIAHCYAGQFGWGFLKVAAGFNPFVIEGTAVAAAPLFDENDIDYMASLAYSHGYKININDMLHGFGFYTSVSSTAYIYAGAFVKFLVNKFGISKFEKFYGSGDFEKIYGKKASEEEIDFYNYLKSYGETGTADQANYYFGRGTIFSKVCPRFVYARLQKAWTDYSGGNYPEAKKTFLEILKKTDNYSALVGYAESLAKLNMIDSAAEIMSRRISRFKNTGSYYNLELRLADLSAEKGNYHLSDSLYYELKLQNPSRVLLYLSDLRLALLKDTASLKLYLNGSNMDKYEVLKKINSREYIYSSVPVMIELSESLNENYRLFLNNFNKPLESFDYISSYAVYKISTYMLNNLDYSGAKKIAALSLRHRQDKNFTTILNDNFNMCNWIYENNKQVLKRANFLTTN